jgi:hypothetical protein
MGLDSFFQKTLITTTGTWTVQPEDVFEDTVFKLGFEIVEF